MEHRLSVRRPIELMVRMVAGGRVVAITRTQDISSGGASILNPDVEFKQRRILTLDFIKPGFPGQVHCSLRAMVIHITPKIIGLMFENEFAGCDLIAQHDHVSIPPFVQRSPDESQ